MLTLIITNLLQSEINLTQLTPSRQEKTPSFSKKSIKKSTIFKAFLLLIVHFMHL